MRLPSHASQADPESESLKSPPGPRPGPVKERQGVSIWVCTTNLGRLRADASERYSAMEIGYQDLFRGLDTGITIQYEIQDLPPLEMLEWRERGSPSGTASSSDEALPVTGARWTPAWCWRLFTHCIARFRFCCSEVASPRLSLPFFYYHLHSFTTEYHLSNP